MLAYRSLYLGVTVLLFGSTLAAPSSRKDFREPHHSSREHNTARIDQRPNIAPNLLDLNDAKRISSYHTHAASNIPGVNPDTFEKEDLNRLNPDDQYLLLMHTAYRNAADSISTAHIDALQQAGVPFSEPRSVFRPPRLVRQDYGDVPGIQQVMENNGK